MAQRRLHEQQDVVGEVDDRLAVDTEVAQRPRGVERPEHELLIAPAHPHRGAVDHPVRTGRGHHGLDQRRLLSIVRQG
jgi:hypothetical protein